MIDKPKTPEQKIEKLVADQARRISDLEAALRSQAARDPDGWRETDETQREEIARLRDLNEYSFKRITELEAALRDIHRETNSSHEAREIIGYVRQAAATALKS